MAKNIGQANSNTSTNTLLANLKNKVHNFVVFDNQGELVGKVQDLIVDANHRLNLVISNQVNQPILESGQHLADKHAFLFRVQSQRIKKIDNPTKSVFIDLDKSEIEYMPEYLETETPGDRKLSEISENSTNQLAYNQTTNNFIESTNLEDISEERIIRLLEERLVVESKKRRLGEVIVRKEIETRMVQVPVRREKLIIEQVSPEHKQLAEIDLSQGEISGLELTELERLEVTRFDGGLTVSGELSSPKIASLLLNAIALEKNHGCKQVQVTISVEDESHQKKYQEWFDRCSKGQQPKPEK
ncbi:MAG: YsnF/AvaK domain-containing protein [Desmonostoc geniculatum HA4340-LM1]|jgi:stress response protein YsnF/sporulation protein YlmC with PRC-barrel domain|nr:YsnF/AvaK domain-containing protein [Desmonostoc geniculatum HA4340-LM1]